MAKAQARTTTDHQEIRRWAEERGAAPACVKGTGGEGDIGMLRLDFPGYSGQDSLQHISWDEWFDKFDERGLALLHQDKTARGQNSNFNKLIARETAEARRQRSRTGATSKGARVSSTELTSGKSRAAKRAATRQPATAAARRLSSQRAGGGPRVLTDHDDIRRWAKSRDARPACVRGTGGKRGDVGMIRLDFPGFSGQRSLQHIDWDDWFRAFEDSKLALIVQETTARGQKSNFNKLVGRETAAARQRGVTRASRRHPERASTAKTSGRASNKSTTRAKRGSTRAKRTESVRGRTASRRRAA